MGIFFCECRFQMTDSLSFRNESFRFILDQWVIYHRQNYRFEMITPCPFEMIDGFRFEMADGLSLRNDRWTVASR